MFQTDAGLLGVQRLGLHQGLSCTLGMGRGGCCPRQGIGGTSVSLQVTRVGEGFRGAKGQALPSLVTLPRGMEYTEIIRGLFMEISVYWKSKTEDPAPSKWASARELKHKRPLVPTASRKSN